LPAQAPTPAGPGAGATRDRGRQDPDTQILLRLEDEWAAALVRRDGATFQRLLADGFVYTEDDRTSGRDAVLQEIVAGTDTVQAARNEDMQVHRFGTTAAVTGWLIVRGRGTGGPFDRRYRFTDTWVRRGGRWQVVAAHDYLVPARPH
jgi:ketosteroid isomerase-like protein